MQRPEKRLRESIMLIIVIDANVAYQGFAEFVDVLVFHEYEDESFELDTSVLATFPSLLAPSSSLTALSSVSSDFDTFHFVASESSASSHPTISMNDGKLFSSSAFTMAQR
jgi:hypothetical protein